MGVLTWSPLAWGLLTGKYRAGQNTPVSPGRAKWGPRHMSDRNKAAVVEQLAPVAEGAGISMTYLAMAFVMAHHAITSAIIGPRTLAQLDDLLAGAGITLDDDTLDRIDEIVAPGTDVGVSDVGYVPPSLSDAALRRRIPGDRTAE